MSIPEEFELQYTRADIASAVRRLGGDISSWVASRPAESELILIPILRGALFFAADLARELNASVEISPISYQTYAGNEAKTVTAPPELPFPVTGRTVLLVDDICESGHTLSELAHACQKANACEVRSAVVINRQRAQSQFTPTWAAFSYDGPEWFVGYGLDDNGRWRNLPDIYLIRKPSRPSL